MLKTAIIGGTGVYDPYLIEDMEERLIATPYGEAKVITGLFQGEEVAFLARHGEKHSVPPHLINYRANIMALKMLGVQNIIATAAVGSLYFEFKPGNIILADQFLDFTHCRPSSFYEGGERGVVHCDMTVPYCPELRQALVKAGADNGVELNNGGTYVCTDGPRFETAAEIAMFKQLGGHMVGMTSVPEVCLARELGICYANISIVTNFAAGIAPGVLTHSEVLEMMKGSLDDIRKIMTDSLKYIGEKAPCDCASILNEPGVMK